MSERFKVTTSKVVVGVTLPRVRIPPSPNGTGFGESQCPFRFWGEDEKPLLRVRADFRTAFMPDSEQILLTGTKYRKQNSVSVEQIQDNPSLPTTLKDSERSLFLMGGFSRCIFLSCIFSDSLRIW